jgi:hypothetical protein
MMSEKPRSAGERHEERLMGKSSAEVISAAKEAAEIETTWRVYRREWVHVGTFESEEAAQADIAAKWVDRLPEEDIHIQQVMTTSHALYVRKWNVAAEHKDESTALDYAADLLVNHNVPGADLKVVERNSREEHLLMQVGVLKQA